MPDNDLHEIIKVAIQREIEAQELYLGAVAMVPEEHLKDLLRDLAAQEVGHKKKLEALLAGKLDAALSQPLPEVVDQKITDYLVEVPLSPDADFQDILIVAGKREKAANALYLDLAATVGDGAAAELFSYLAAQELSHKERVETLYAKYVYNEN